MCAVALIVFLLEHQRKMVRLIRGEKVEEGPDVIAAMMGGSAASDGKIKGLESRIEHLERTVFMLQANSAAQELPGKPSQPIG